MKKLLFLLVLFESYYSYAKSDSLELQNLRQRVKLLEDYKSNMDKLYEARHIELLTKETQFENTYNLKQTWWQLLVAFSIGGGITFLSLKRWVKEKADEHYNKNLQMLLDGKSDIIKQIMSEYDAEQILKKEKKVLVVSKNSGSSVFRRIRNNFADVDESLFFIDFKDKIERKKYDLVVFDGIEEIKSDNYKVIESMLIEGKKVFVHNVKIDAPELMAKIGSSNLLSQLIGNIMNLLKYN